MKQERFITTFAAALVVCLLVAGYAAMTAAYSAAEAPPVPADYVAEVLSPAAAPAEADPDSLPGRLSQVQSAFADAVTAFSSDASFAAKAAAACGETVAEWESVELSAGQKIYLAEGSLAVLRKGGATCIESASVGLTDRSLSRMLEEGDELSTAILYEAAAPAAGFQAVRACTAIIHGSYSLA